LLHHVYKDFIFLNLFVMLVLNMLVHVIRTLLLIHAFLDILKSKEIVLDVHQELQHVHLLILL